MHENDIPKPPYSRRGRPKKEALDENTNKRAIEVKAQRRRRKDFGPLAGLTLSVPDRLKNDREFRYRWANDDPGRLKLLTENDDWDFVTDEETSKDKRNSGVGTRIERLVGMDKYGNPQRAFLLRKSKKFDEEDKMMKRKIRKQRVTDLRQGSVPGAAMGSNMYVRNIEITETNQ